MKKYREDKTIKWFDIDDRNYTIPKDRDFLVKFDDGSIFKYYDDEHPFAIIEYWAEIPEEGPDYVDMVLKENDIYNKQQTDQELIRSNSINQKYQNITTLDEALKLIEEQDRMIGQLTRENNENKDTISRLKECTRKRKKAAGYDDSTSFDVIWDDMLNVYLNRPK